MNAPLRSTAPVLLRENLDDVALLTLNRPQARNSLSEALLAALTETLAQIAADKRVRAVVLAANGPSLLHRIRRVLGDTLTGWQLLPGPAAIVAIVDSAAMFRPSPLLAKRCSTRTNHHMGAF